MRTLTTLNAEPAGDEVRVESLHGREWLVAPVVLVRQGVLNGGYLGFDEIQKSAPAWNGEPVTAPPAPETEAASLAPGEPSGHPIAGKTDDGAPNFVSANREPFVEDMRVGMILNAEADDDLPTPGDEMSDKGLVGEAWLDLERVENVGANAVEAVEAIAEAEPLDVSTGYFHRPVRSNGRHDGERYEVEQKDVLPDHLALLPNERGACSWADGCGSPYASNLDSFGAASAEGGAASGRTLAVNQSEGDLVRWSASGGTAYGRVDEVREGEDAEPFDDEIDGDAGPIGPPAALVEVHRPDGDEWVPTGTMVAHRTDTDTLTVIDELPDTSEANVYTAANLLDEARRPTFDGTREGEVPDRWPPTLDEYVRHLDIPEDATNVSDLDESERQAIAEHTLLGDASADTMSELSFFPVVEPSSSELVEGALDAVIGGRGAQADIDDGQLESARRVAYGLLNDEELFDRDLDVPDELTNNADLDDEGGLVSWVRGLLSNDDAGGCSPGPCSCGLHSPNEPEDYYGINMKYDINELAAMSAFDRETLESMSEERLALLAESLDGDDGGTTANNDDDGSTDDTSDLAARVEELERQVAAQEQEKRERLAERVATHTEHDAEELAGNTDEFPTAALETLAETVEPNGDDGGTSQDYAGRQGDRVNYMGQAGGSPDSDDDADATEATANVGALAAMSEADD